MAFTSLDTKYTGFHSKMSGNINRSGFKYKNMPKYCKNIQMLKNDF